MSIRNLSTDATNAKKREAMRRLRAQRADVIIPKPKHIAERNKCKNSLLLFCETFLSHLFPLEFSPTHKSVINNIQTTILKGKSYAICLPRGSGKSTIMLAAIIWSAIYGHRKFSVLLRATVADAKYVIRDILDILETSNTKLSEAFPETCFPYQAIAGSPRKAPKQTAGGERTKIVAGVDRLVFPTVHKSPASGCIILAKGISGSLRGLNHGGIRPDFCLLDDCEDQEVAWCERSITRITRTINADVAGLAGPGRSTASFFLGTIQRRGCVADVFSDRKLKPSWRGQRFSALIHPPDRLDLWAEYETKRKENPDDANSFYQSQKEIMDHNSEVLWDKRYDPQSEVSALQSIMNFKADNGELAFLTELQNNPPDEVMKQEDHLSTKQITTKIITIEKNIVPNSTTRIIVSADLGKHVLHYIVCGYQTTDGSGHIIDYGTIDVPINPDTSYAITKALSILRDEVVRPGWKDEAGGQRYADGILIDSGYHPDSVYEFCRQHGFLRWKPIKGEGTGDHNGQRRSRFYLPKNMPAGGIISGDAWYISKVKNSILCHLDVDSLKERVHDRFRLPMDSPGGWSIYSGSWQDHIRLASHITSEKLTEDFVPGKGVNRAWKRQSKANHYLDCLTYNLAGLSIFGGTPKASTSLNPQSINLSDKSNPSNLPPINTPKKPRRIAQIRRIGNYTPPPF